MSEASLIFIFQTQLQTEKRRNQELTKELESKTLELDKARFFLDKRKSKFSTLVTRKISMAGKRIGAAENACEIACNNKFSRSR